MPMIKTRIQNGLKSTIQNSGLLFPCQKLNPNMQFMYISLCDVTMRMLYNT
jgi:hypothetical protein